jgi:antitoxin component of MazEF toxin-antitoxin module
MRSDKGVLVKVGNWGRSIGLRIPSSIVAHHSLKSNDDLRVTLSETGFNVDVVRGVHKVLDEKALIKSIAKGIA